MEKKEVFYEFKNHLLASCSLFSRLNKIHYELSLFDFYIGLDQHKLMIGTKTTVLITDGNTNRVIKYNKSSLLLLDKGLPFTGNQ